MPTLDSLKALCSLAADGKTYHYCNLPEAARTLGDLSKLLVPLKVLLENFLRWEDGNTVTGDDLKTLTGWLGECRSGREIQYRPARVLVRDFIGVPVVVDLAAMRTAMAKAGDDPQKISPLPPVNLVTNHSVMIDKFASESASEQGVEIEMQHNGEHYAFLRQGQNAFDNFSMVPSGTGTYHQVNLEYLGRMVWTREEDGRTHAFPDTLVGADSCTTMINDPGALGWGVGGTEAEAVMPSQSVSMLIPEVIGFRLTGKLREDTTAIDLVLTVTRMLCKKGVVGKFVKLYGDDLADLPLADRVTIANMTPEYGTTCGLFLVDEIILGYLRLFGRPESTVKLVEAYSEEQGLWRERGHEPVFIDTLHLDMGEVEASLAGSKRSQDRVVLQNVANALNELLGLQLHPSSTEEGRLLSEGGGGTAADANTIFDETDYQHGGQTHRLKSDVVVIAIITSYTNISNPSVMMTADLLVERAVEEGLQRKPQVKSSLAPGSGVVTDYFEAAGLTHYPDKLSSDLVGYDCTVCIGNSGPLLEPVKKAIWQVDLTIASAPSGNHNFEGRVHPLIKTNWLASSPPMVAYTLTGGVRINLSKESLGTSKDGQPVHLRDIWSSQREIAETVQKIDTEVFYKEYAEAFVSDERWQTIQVPQPDTYERQANSAYAQHSPFFRHIIEAPSAIADVGQARVPAALGDSVTADHVSPTGNIKADNLAGRYPREHGVESRDFNSYGPRRGNHEVMMRGTLANIRVKNGILDGKEGGSTLYMPSDERLVVYDAVMRYQQDGTPLAIVTDKEHSTGSSRDWVAEDANLLGVKAVVAESSERIRRSNLAGVGVLSLQFENGQDHKGLKLTGEEVLNIRGLGGGLKPHTPFSVEVTHEDGSQDSFEVLCRIDTLSEVEYFKADGILHYALRSML